jgi:hypothetical protein
MEALKERIINETPYQQKTAYFVAKMGEFALQWIGYVDLYAAENPLPVFHANLPFKAYDEVAFNADGSEKLEETIMAEAEAAADTILNDIATPLAEFLADYENAKIRGLY